MNNELVLKTHAATLVAQINNTDDEYASIDVYKDNNGKLELISSTEIYLEEAKIKTHAYKKDEEEPISTTYENLTEYVYTNLTKEERLELIAVFNYCYFNTDQDIKDFSVEYYEVSNMLLKSYIPVKLIFLSDFEEEVVKAVPRLKENYNL